MIKTTVRTAGVLFLTVGLLTLFLYNVDLAEVGRALAAADPRLVAAAVVSGLFSYWLRAVRWQLILRSAGATRHSTAVMATAVGYAAMTLLPARAGDVVRPILLARRDPVPTSAALASVVTERIFDLLMVVSFFVTFLVWPPAMVMAGAGAEHTLHLLTVTGWVVGTGCVTATGVLLLMLRLQDRLVTVVTLPLARFRPAWQAPVAAFLHHFLDGMRVVSRPLDLALTLSMSVVIWLFAYLHVFLTLLAFDLHLPFRATFLVVTLAVIGMAIPTPGGIGGIHKGTQIALTQFFAVDLGRATGVAIVYHAGAFLPITLIGLLCLPLLGLDLRQVRQVAAGASAPAEEVRP